MFGFQKIRLYIYFYTYILKKVSLKFDMFHFFFNPVSLHTYNRGKDGGS